MNYLIDATFGIDLLNERAYVSTILPTLLDGGFALSILTYMELWEGVYTNRDPERAEVGLCSLLSGVEVLPFSTEIARRAARLRG